jgi:Ca2+-binding RTX toxin-like protein
MSPPRCAPPARTVHRVRMPRVLALCLACLLVVALASVAVAATLDGTPGPDRLIGTSGADRLSGRAGADTLIGRRGSDRLAGGPGDDLLAGDAGRDTLIGCRGADTLLGGAGGDRLSAATRDDAGDVVLGGVGSDVIDTLDGSPDRITCGAGRDRVRADRGDRIGRGCEQVRRG